jgi:hypothetical protein
MTTTVKFHSTGEKRFPQEVVGESKYQDNLRSIIGRVSGQDYYKKQDFTAYLFLENQNQFDPGNAIRIEINKLTVGYLSRSDAQKYRQALADTKLSDKNLVGSCGASIYGKKEKGEKDFILGVWLDLNLDNLRYDLLNPAQRKFNWRHLSKKQKLAVGCGLILIILLLCIVLTSICSAFGVIGSESSFSINSLIRA